MNMIEEDAATPEDKFRSALSTLMNGTAVAESGKSNLSVYPLEPNHYWAA
jgi:hypothetical protein